MRGKEREVKSDTDMTVGECVAEDYRSAKVFEKFGQTRRQVWAGVRGSADVTTR